MSLERFSLFCVAVTLLSVISTSQLFILLVVGRQHVVRQELFAAKHFSLFGLEMRFDQSCP